jgi:hypothetical protein
MSLPATREAGRETKSACIAVCQQILGADCVVPDPPLGGALNHFELVPIAGICAVFMMSSMTTGTVHYAAADQEVVHLFDFGASC